MEYNLTEGNITGKLLKFAFPLMIGNLLQQCYNIADTLIVGRFLGADALAAVLFSPCSVDPVIRTG